nr:NADH dehydrogenase subunit 2 [Pleonosporium sp.]
MFYLNYNLYSILPEIFILICTCVLILFSVISSTSSKLGFPVISVNLFYLILQILLFSLMILIQQSPIYFISWNNFFITNSFTYFSKIIMLILFLLWLSLSINFNIDNKINKFEFWILILLSLLASFSIIQTYDILAIYLSLEFQSLILYILASFSRNSEFSTESGLKYFILGALSSALLLFGISMLYSLTGASNLTDLSKLFLGELVTNSILYSEVFSCLTFIIVALLFKFTAAPFHFWAPDVYEGAPTSVTLFFATIPKLTTLCLLIKIISVTSNQLIFNFYYLFLLSIFTSSIIGVSGAFYQTKWKRFITYSSISHVSFFLVNFIYWDIFNFITLFFYLKVYLIMVFAFFAFFMNFRFLSYPKFNQVRYLKSINFINEVNPTISFSVSLVLFSMAGIPPLGGFFSKFFVFLIGIKKQIIGIVLILVIFGCVSCFYYLRIIKKIYFGGTSTLFPVFKSISKLNSLVLGLCIIFLIFWFRELNFIFIFLNTIMFSFIY